VVRDENKLLSADSLFTENRKKILKYTRYDVYGKWGNERFVDIDAQRKIKTRKNANN